MASSFTSSSLATRHASSKRPSPAPTRLEWAMRAACAQKLRAGRSDGFTRAPPAGFRVRIQRPATATALRSSPQRRRRRFTCRGCPWELAVRASRGGGSARSKREAVPPGRAGATPSEHRWVGDTDARAPDMRLSHSAAHSCSFSAACCSVLSCAACAGTLLRCACGSPQAENFPKIKPALGERRGASHSQSIDLYEVTYK